MFTQNNGSSTPPHLTASQVEVEYTTTKTVIPSLQLTVSHGEVPFTAHKTILPPVLTSRGRVHTKQTVLPTPPHFTVSRAEVGFTSNKTILWPVLI